MSILNIPLGAVRLAIQSDLKILQTQSHTIIGGLLKESSGEIARAKKEFWEPGRGNGNVYRTRDVPENMGHLARFQIPLTETSIWLPDEESMNSITSAALEKIGAGSVKWFGALGSQTDSLHAGYQEPDKAWVVGEKNWNWKEATDQLMIASNTSLQSQRFQEALKTEAERYGHAVLKEAGYINRGEVYGLAVYAIKHGKSKRDEEYDVETWGLVSKEYAIESLENAMTELGAQIEGQNDTERPRGN